MPAAISGFWSFYSADATALFFKRIALLTTIVVLVMALEYKSVLAKFIPGVTPGAGLGEFYSLPVFTCAGLMFMASAVDFLLDLRLARTRHHQLLRARRLHAAQSASLEAGVKYLILGALSTGFLVYGITWIFGVTGQTNLAAHRRKAAAPARLAGAAALRHRAHPRRARLQGRRRAVPALGARCLSRRAHADHRLSLSVGSKAAGFIVLLRVLQPFLAVPALEEKILAVLAILAGPRSSTATSPRCRRITSSACSPTPPSRTPAICSSPWPASAADLSGFGSSRVAVAYYLAGYLLMTLLSFLVLIVVANHSRGDDIVHFNGLAKRSPFLAFGLLVAMLSLAGIPFTAGFYRQVPRLRHRRAGAAITASSASASSPSPRASTTTCASSARCIGRNRDDTRITIAPLARFTISALTLAIFVFGIFPQPILGMLRGRVGKGEHLGGHDHRGNEVSLGATGQASLRCVGRRP